MKSQRIVAGIAAATFACLGMVACSPSTPGTSPTGGTSASADASSPSGTDTTSATPSPEASATEEVPTREALVDAAVKLAQDNGVPADKARGAAECVADRGYDTWSDQTLIALGKGDPQGVAENEREDVTRAIGDCARKAIMGN